MSNEMLKTSAGTMKYSSYPLQINDCVCGVGVAWLDDGNPVTKVAEVSKMIAITKPPGCRSFAELIGLGATPTEHN
jgi:hypothetical protein